MKPAYTKGMLLLTVILMDILGGAEIDLFVPSFPELQHQFNLSPFWVEALLSANFAGFCVSLLFIGSLADHYSRRPVIVLGLVIFIVGTVLCLSAGSYPALLSGRFLQGVGIAAPATLCFLIVADAYALKEQQYIMAILNGLINISIGAAPVVGSYVAMYFHWQGNFMVLLVMGAVVLVMTFLFIPSQKLPVLNSAAAIGGYTSISQSKSLLLLIIYIVLIFVPYWVFAGISPLLYMEDLGVSLSHFGYYQGSLAIVFAVGSIMSGLIVNKYNQKKLLYASGYLCFLGLLAIGYVAFVETSNPVLITLAFLVYIIGMIVPNTIFYPLCLNFIPQAKGRVSAIIQGARLIATALCLELAGYFYDGSFQNIGGIIGGIIAISIITLFLVVKNRGILPQS